MNVTKHRWSSRSWTAPLITSALIVAFLLSFSVPWNLNSLRGWIEQKVQTSTGRSLKLDGDLTLYWGLFHSDGTHITAERLRLGNPDWAQRPEMFTTDRLDAGIAVWRLLTGEVYLPYLILDKPDAEFEILEDGRHNWAIDTNQKEDRNLPFKIGSLKLNSGRISYLASHLKTNIQADLKTVTAEDQSNHIVVAATGTWRGLTLVAHGRGADVLRLHDTSMAYDLDLHGSIGQTRVDAQGSVTGLLEPRVVSVKLKVSGASMGEWYEIAHIGLPDTPPYRTEGRVSLNEGIWYYDDFTGQLGQSEIGGSVTFEPRNARRPQRPFLSGKVYSPHLDLKDIGPLIGKTPTASATTEEKSATKAVHRMLPQKQFESARWDTLDADLNFEAKQVRNLAALPFDNLNGRLIVKDKILTLAPLRFGFANGELSNEIRIDGQTNPMQGRIDGKFRNLQLVQLLPSLRDSKAALGNVNGKIILNGQGNSIAALLGTSTGTIQLAMGRGTISNLQLELLDLDAFEALGFLIRGDRSVRIRCGVADLEVKNGVMTPHAFVFDTTDTIVTVQGPTNFATENLDLKVLPVPKDKSLLTLRVPMHVRGPFSHPDIGPDKGLLTLRAGSAILLGLINPLAALIPLFETGPGKDSSCTALLNHIKNVPVRNMDAAKTTSVKTNSPEKLKASK